MVRTRPLSKSRPNRSIRMMDGSSCGIPAGRITDVRHAQTPIFVQPATGRANGIRNIDRGIVPAVLKNHRDSCKRFAASPFVEVLWERWGGTAHLVPQHPLALGMAGRCRVEHGVGPSHHFPLASGVSHPVANL